VATFQLKLGGTKGDVLARVSKDHGALLLVNLAAVSDAKDRR
jgi:hypothetical protein